MLPAREYFFILLVIVYSSLAKGMLFGNLSLGKVCFLVVLLKETSTCGNSCLETENFGGFSLEETKSLQFLFKFMALLM